jgi:hypothetical protein
MTFDDFILRLQLAGWRDSMDAQHTNIAALWAELDAQENYARKWIRADESIQMLRRMCEQAKKEGWQHLAIDTVASLIEIPALTKEGEWKHESP